MSKAARRGTLVGFLLVAIALRAGFVAMPVTHLEEMLSDDAFYYIVGARHMRLDGGWPTMDGFHPTSGFHPLFMLLVAALDALAAASGVAVTRLVVGVNLAIGLAAALLAARLARSPGGGDAGDRGRALLAALILLTSPTWIAHALAGVENMLAALAIAIWLGRILVRVDRGGSDAAAWGLLTVLADGLWLGIAGLARTDAALMGLGVGLALVAIAPRGHRRAALARTGLMGAVALAVVSPWLVLLLLEQGSILQDSARAILARTARESGGGLAFLEGVARNVTFWGYRLLHTPAGPASGGLLLGLGIAALCLRGRTNGEPRAPGTPNGRARLAGVLSIVLLVDGLGWIVRANSIWNIRSQVELGAEIAVATVLAGIGFRLEPLSRPSKGGSEPNWRWWCVLVLPILVSIVTYTVHFRHFQLWYASTATLLLTIGAARLLAARLNASGCVAVGAALIAVALTLNARVLTRGTYARFEAARTGERREVVAAMLPPGSTHPTLGSFDSGRLSYRLWPYPVANLDGVMSHAAALAIESGELGRFLEDTGIGHVAGPAARIAHFASIGGFSYAREAALSGGTGLSIYRVGERGGESAAR